MLSFIGISLIMVFLPSSRTVTKTLFSLLISQCFLKILNFIRHFDISQIVLGSLPFSFYSLHLLVLFVWFETKCHSNFCLPGNVYSALLFYIHCNPPASASQVWDYRFKPPHQAHFLHCFPCNLRTNSYLLKQVK